MYHYTVCFILLFVTITSASNKNDYVISAPPHQEIHAIKNELLHKKRTIETNQLINNENDQININAKRSDSHHDDDDDEWIQVLSFILAIIIIIAIVGFIAATLYYIPPDHHYHHHHNQYPSKRVQHHHHQTYYQHVV
jgi:hypothetical protein